MTRRDVLRLAASCAALYALPSPDVPFTYGDARCEQEDAGATTHDDLRNPANDACAIPHARNRARGGYISAV